MSDPREELEKLLETLGESAHFVAAGSLAPVLPGLEVVGIGSIGTPVSAADAGRLIEKASQAPFGRGEETILDTDVRRVWQLEPADFALENSQWTSQVEGIVARVVHDFGIKQGVKAELYKLLVYEPGSFFTGHRDTEKTKGMFATLVICLPSKHEGGTLVVEHDGQSKEIVFAAKERAFETQYAAFYADCRHEVRPVTSRYRICLIYNLSTTGRAKLGPPKNAAAAAAAADLLEKIFADATSGPQKIVIPFRHHYSEAGFDPLSLKGADRTRAEILTRAADNLDYVCHFALATQWQTGIPDNDDLYEKGFYENDFEEDYSDEDDFEDEEDGHTNRDSSGSSSYSADTKNRIDMDEVIDESLSLDQWFDSQGNRLGYEKLAWMNPRSCRAK